MFTRRRGRENTLRTLSSVHFDKVVGVGTFGVVLKATDKVTGDRVALKKIKLENEFHGFPITAIREMKILKELKHKNIVLLSEILVYNPQVDKDLHPDIIESAKLVSEDIFMVLEYCDFDLSGVLRNPNVVVTENHIKSYMKQLLEGVAFMHQNQVLHRDIKGANILITRGNVLKIADWGLARSYQTTQSNQLRLTNPVVTQWYRSPELLLGATSYSVEIDMWSIGCLFAEMRMSSHQPLFPGKSGDDNNQLELIFQLLGSPTGQLEEDFLKLPKCPPNFREWTQHRPSLERKLNRDFDEDSMQLLKKLIELDPKVRVTKAEELLLMRYFWHVPEPHQLPVFTVDCAFSMIEDNRIRKEHKDREEQRKQQHQNHLQQLERTQRANAPPNDHVATVPGGGMAKRIRPLQQSKYAVSKPTAAVAATTTTGGGGVAPPVIAPSAGAAASSSNDSAAPPPPP